MNDSILIRDLELFVLIGTRPEERRQKQKLIINLELFTDLGPAGRSDALADAVDYSRIEENVKRLAEASSYFLLEALGEAICAEVLREPKIRQVRLCIDKPGAPRFARSIAVNLIRRTEGPEA